MSEDNKVTDNQDAEQKAHVLKIGEKEFDISTPEGLLQAQTWGEALSHAIGKQGNELGTLRKFKAERVTAADTEEMLRKVGELREEGRHVEADKLILAHAEERELAVNQKLQNEKANEELWSEYFEARKDLTKLYSKKDLKLLAKNQLDLESVDDPYKALDSLFADKLEKARSLPGSSSSGTPKVQSAAGGRPRSVPAPQPEEGGSEAVDFGDILDGASAYKRK
jgi:hypothetical protein